MGYGILKVNTDWADEFNVIGFKLLNEEDNAKYCEVKDNPDWLDYAINWSFGTNEGFEDDDFHGSDIEYKELTKEEYDTIMKIFKPYCGEYGQFPSDIFYNISCALGNEDEEEDE